MVSVVFSTVSVNAAAKENKFSNGGDLDDVKINVVWKNGEYYIMVTCSKDNDVYLILLDKLGRRSYQEMKYDDGFYAAFLSPKLAQGRNDVFIAVVDAEKELTPDEKGSMEPLNVKIFDLDIKGMRNNVKIRASMVLVSSLVLNTMVDETVCRDQSVNMGRTGVGGTTGPVIDGVRRTSIRTGIGPGSMLDVTNELDIKLPEPDFPVESFFDVFYVVDLHPPDPGSEFNVDSFFDITITLGSERFIVDSFFDIIFRHTNKGTDFAVDSFFDVDYRMDPPSAEQAPRGAGVSPFLEVFTDVDLGLPYPGRVKGDFLADSFFDVFTEVDFAGPVRMTEGLANAEGTFTSGMSGGPADTEDGEKYVNLATGSSGIRYLYPKSQPSLPDMALTNYARAEGGNSKTDPTFNVVTELSFGPTEPPNAVKDPEGDSFFDVFTELSFKPPKMMWPTNPAGGIVDSFFDVFTEISVNGQGRDLVAVNDQDWDLVAVNDHDYDLVADSFFDVFTSLSPDRFAETIPDDIYRYAVDSFFDVLFDITLEDRTDDTQLNNLFNLDMSSGTTVETNTFSEVSGLGIGIEVMEYQEGGVNDKTRKILGPTRFSDITLKRGFSAGIGLFDFFGRPIDGRVETRSSEIRISTMEDPDVKDESGLDWYVDSFFDVFFDIEVETPPDERGSIDIEIVALDLTSDSGLEVTTGKSVFDIFIVINFSLLSSSLDPKGLSIDSFFDVFYDSSGDALGLGKSSFYVDSFFDVFYSLDDTGSDDGSDIRGHTLEISRLAHIDGEQHRPPTCIVSWGAVLDLKGHETYLGERFTKFVPDGTPIRTKIDVKLKEYKSVGEQLKEFNLQGRTKISGDGYNVDSFFDVFTELTFKAHPPEPGKDSIVDSFFDVFTELSLETNTFVDPKKSTMDPASFFDVFVETSIEGLADWSLPDGIRSSFFDVFNGLSVDTTTALVPADGSGRTDSFFDVFTELSLKSQTRLNPKNEFQLESFFDVFFDIEYESLGSNFVIDSFFDITYEIDTSDQDPEGSGRIHLRSRWNRSGESDESGSGFVDTASKYMGVDPSPFKPGRSLFDVSYEASSKTQTYTHTLSLNSLGQMETETEYDHETGMMTDSFFDVFTEVDSYMEDPDYLGASASFFDVFVETSSLFPSGPAKGSRVGSFFDVFAGVTSEDDWEAPVAMVDSFFDVFVELELPNRVSPDDLIFDMSADVSLTSDFRIVGEAWAMDSFFDVFTEIDPVKSSDKDPEPEFQKLRLMMNTAQQVNEVEVRGWDPKPKEPIVDKAYDGKTKMIFTGQLDADLKSTFGKGSEPEMRFSGDSVAKYKTSQPNDPTKKDITALSESFFDVFFELYPEGKGIDNNEPPQVTVDTPASASYHVGNSIQVSGKVIDPSGDEKILNFATEYKLNATADCQKINTGRLKNNSLEVELKAKVISVPLGEDEGGGSGDEVFVDSFFDVFMGFSIDDSGNVMGVEPSPFAVFIDSSMILKGVEPSPFAVKSFFDVFTEVSVAVDLGSVATGPISPPPECPILQIGLSSNEVFEIKEGGLNSHVHKFITRVSYSGDQRSTGSSGRISDSPWGRIGGGSWSRISLGSGAVSGFEPSPFIVDSFFDVFTELTLVSGAVPDGADVASGSGSRSGEINRSKFSKMEFSDTSTVMFNPEKLTVQKQVEWKEQRYGDWAPIDNYSTVDRNERETSGGNVDDSGNVMGVEPSPFRIYSFFDVFVETSGHALGVGQSPFRGVSSIGASMDMIFVTDRGLSDPDRTINSSDVAPWVTKISVNVSLKANIFGNTDPTHAIRNGPMSFEIDIRAYLGTLSLSDLGLQQLEEAGTDISLDVGQLVPSVNLGHRSSISNNNFNIDSFFDISFEINDTDDDEHQRECPECGATVDPDDETCPECGEELGDDPPRLKVAGFDLSHRLTRGTSSRTWGDGPENVSGVDPTPFHAESFFDVFTEISIDDTGNAMGVEPSPFHLLSSFSVYNNVIGEEPGGHVTDPRPDRDWDDLDDFGDNSGSAINHSLVFENTFSMNVSKIHDPNNDILGLGESPFIVDSFFDVFFDITVTDVEPEGEEDPEEEAGSDVTSTLKIRGDIKGEYRPESGVDFIGSISLDSKFEYKKDNVTATLKAGSRLTVDVKKNELKTANFSVEAEISYKVESNVTSTLKINGKVDGKYETGAGFDLTGTLTLVPPFQYKKGKVTATLMASSSLSVEIKANELETVEFNVDADVSYEVESDVISTLKLNGKIEGKYENGSGFDVTANLTLVPPFEYGKDKLNVNLTAGARLSLNVTKNKFKTANFSAEVDVSYEVESDVTSTLKLNGKIEGKYESGGGEDLEGSISLQSSFEYEIGKINASLKAGGRLSVNVTKNQFKWANLTGLKIDASVSIGDKNLTLGGSIEGSINEAYEVSFDGSIELKNDVEKDFDESVKVGISAGARLTVHVENNAFKGAELTGIQISADIAINDSILKLRGSIQGKYETNGTDQDGNTDGSFIIDSFFDVYVEIGTSGDDERQRECPECGAQVGKDDVTCPECGEELDDDNEGRTFTRFNVSLEINTQSDGGIWVSGSAPPGEKIELVDPDGQNAIGIYLQVSHSIHATGIEAGISHRTGNSTSVSFFDIFTELNLGGGGSAGSFKFGLSVLINSINDTGSSDGNPDSGYQCIRGSINSFFDITIGADQDDNSSNIMYRVTVKFPWILDTDNDNADFKTNWVRVFALLGDVGQGYWFLPEVDDEVLVAFEFGDIRRPLVVGCLWNGVDLPPVSMESESDEDRGNRYDIVEVAPTIDETNDELTGFDVSYNGLIEPKDLPDVDNLTAKMTIKNLKPGIKPEYKLETKMNADKESKYLVTEESGFEVISRNGESRSILKITLTVYKLSKDPTTGNDVKEVAFVHTILVNLTAELDDAGNVGDIRSIVVDSTVDWQEDQNDTTRDEQDN